MPGSVNVNEPFRDRDPDDDAPEAYLENLDESDEFLLDPSPLTSADPHRTLSWADPHRMGRAASDLMQQAAPPKIAANRVGELRSGTTQATRDLKAASGPDLGPCLYFGPAGQRCDRRASAGSFCERHQAKEADRYGEASSTSLPQVTKRALGAAGILAVLWPILFNLIRELLRFLR